MGKGNIFAFFGLKFQSSLSSSSNVGMIHRVGLGPAETHLVFSGQGLDSSGAKRTGCYWPVYPRTRASAHAEANEVQALSLNIPSSQPCGDGATVDYPGKGQAVLWARRLEHYALPSLPRQLALPS